MGEGFCASCVLLARRWRRICLSVSMTANNGYFRQPSLEVDAGAVSVHTVNAVNVKTVALEVDRHSLQTRPLNFYPPSTGSKDGHSYRRHTPLRPQTAIVFPGRRVLYKVDQLIAAESMHVFG